LDKELLKALSDLLDEKLSPIKDDISNIKTQQVESISILRSLEHRADVTKSEHDKLLNDIVKLSGTLENMRKDLSAVEVVTARNLENIAQLKIAK
jgi:hypothetical protein